MEKLLYRTGDTCPQDGSYQCQLSREIQKYKKGDIFDYCPTGKRTKWEKIN
jgi:hypothetical protein